MRSWTPVATDETSQVKAAIVAMRNAWSAHMFQPTSPPLVAIGSATENPIHAPTTAKETPMGLTTGCEACLRKTWRRMMKRINIWMPIETSMPTKNPVPMPNRIVSASTATEPAVSFAGGSARTTAAGANAGTCASVRGCAIAAECADVVAEPIDAAAETTS